MSGLDPSFYLYATITLVAGIVWAVRLEGRVNTSDRRFESTEKRFDDLQKDVEYIRGRIDRAINGRRDG